MAYIGLGNFLTVGAFITENKDHNLLILTEIWQSLSCFYGWRTLCYNSAFAL